MANDLSVKKETGIAGYIGREDVRSNIENVIGKENFNTFITDIVAVTQANPQLASCTNASIISASLVSRSAGLKLTPSFAQVYLIPYDNKKTYIDENGRKVTKEVKEATLQIGKKGYVELALRNGYKLNVSDVRRGEMKRYDPINDMYEFEALPIEVRTQKDANGNYIKPIIGYYAFYEKNGFRKGLYMSVEELDEHGRKYSVSYKSDLKYNNSKSLWKTNFDAMCRKTVMKRLLREYASLDFESTRVVNADMGVVGDDLVTVDYVDNKADEPREVVNPLADVIDVEATDVTDGGSENPNVELPSFLK